MDTEPTLSKALAHHQAGRLDEAQRGYRAVLNVSPEHPDALHLLGMVEHQSGNSAVGAELIVRAIAQRPDIAQYHVNLAAVCLSLGDPAKAGLACKYAYQLKPALMPSLNWAILFNQVGEQLMARGDMNNAALALDRASQCDATLPEPLNNLGLCLREMGDLHRAVTAFEKAIARRPALVDPHLNLGVTLIQTGDIERAVDSLKETVRLRPDLALAHTNLGVALRHLEAAPGEAFNAARRSLEKAIELEPQSIAAHKNLGIVDLLLGDFQRGWPNWEWRLLEKEQSARTFPEPRWQGEPLKNRRILLHIEQGLGDMIQMARYVPMVAAQGGRIILECFPPLLNLMTGIAGVEQFVSAGSPLPEFHVRCSMMSLPFLFGTTLQTIPPPAVLPALSRDLADGWAKRTGPGRALRVGISWAGSALHHNDRHRSMQLLQFHELLATPGVRFFSLQKGIPAEQLLAVPAANKVHDFTTHLTDFQQTAALIQNLDLVITVDTAIAHLAATLGKPTWVLLPFAPDWRWMLKRSDSPWYPSMRLIRQLTRGDWQSVLIPVCHSLKMLTADSA